MITVPRRSEFQETRWGVAADVLSRARYGHVASVGPDGRPQVWPLNYVLLDRDLYFHGSPRSGLSGCAGRSVAFTAEDSLAWIPSSWRHPEMACPATTYYRSVQVHGVLEPAGEKARVLAAFMARYQPQGGYRPLTEPRYESSLQSLAVLRLPVAEWICRVKMGQHLPEGQRRRVHDALVRRGRRGDREVAARMRQANADLAHTDLWTDDPTAVPLDQLHALLNETYWAAGRPLHTVQRHLWESDLTMAAVEDGRLLAYARMASPGRGVAWLFDVVVQEGLRARGLGTELMRRLLEHPRAERWPRLFLDTCDAMDFYRRFGFVELKRGPRNGGSSLMLREVPARADP